MCELGYRCKLGPCISKKDMRDPIAREHELNQCKIAWVYRKVPVSAAQLLRKTKLSILLLLHAYQHDILKQTQHDAGYPGLLIQHSHNTY